MTERFVTDVGTISIGTGGTTVVGVGTLFAGRDRAAAHVLAFPPSSVPVTVGIVAEVDPRGEYDNLSLPILHAYNGPALTNVPYALVDGAAISNAATQIAVYARYTAFLEQNMGLVGNTADSINYALVPNNSLFVDEPTRAIYQWRNGVLEQVTTIAQAFSPKGLWLNTSTYALNALVQFSNFMFVSNEAGNIGHQPVINSSGGPMSDVHWTWFPLPTPEAFTAGANLVMDSGGSVIATGPAGDHIVPFDCTILQATLIADGVGSMVVEVWRSTYAAAPPTSGGKITASAPPTLSAANKSRDSVLAGWTTSLHADDVLRLNVVSCSGLTRVTLALKLQRVWPLS